MKLISKSRSNSKVIKNLKRLWYKKDFVGWIKQLELIGRIHTNKDNPFTPSFLEFSKRWNLREDILHEPGNYKGWNPYCGRIHKVPEERSSICSWPRMVRYEWGWKCPECGNCIGKHLHRIPTTWAGEPELSNVIPLPAMWDNGPVIRNPYAFASVNICN